MSSTSFRHNGICYEVVNPTPDFAHIAPGMWLRLSYDPYDSKPDEVGEVLSCKQDEYGYRDYIVVLARDGDKQQRRDLRSSDGAFEVIRKIPTEACDSP